MNTQNAPFRSVFFHACPEPVLAKTSFVYKEMASIQRNSAFAPHRADAEVIVSLVVQVVLQRSHDLRLHTMRLCRTKRETCAKHSSLKFLPSRLSRACLDKS
jgi:hypothetical protein